MKRRSITPTRHLPELTIPPDTFQVCSERVVLIAQLEGALGLCLHNEETAVGGLLHLRFKGDAGRPSDLTDNSLSAVLVSVDNFKRSILGNSHRSDLIHARIVAQVPPPMDSAEPNASLVDLIKADLADDKIICGTQLNRQIESLRVCFEPFGGRVWVNRNDSPQKRQSA